MKYPDNWCDPSKLMNSTYFYDAKKECDSISSCHMFYDSHGNGSVFYSCENTASIKKSYAGSILYQVGSGNKKYMQYEYFRDTSQMWWIWLCLKSLLCLTHYISYSLIIWRFSWRIRRWIRWSRRRRIRRSIWVR